MKRLIFLLAISVALLAPAGALASGVVLKVQRSSHLVAVTRSASHVALVHTSAAARLHVGQRVSMASRHLRNGTFAGSRVRVVGRAHTVRFRGILLSRSRTRLVVSAGGALLSIHRGARTTSSARDHGRGNDDNADPGNVIDMVVTFDDENNELDEDNVAVVAPSAPGGQLEGTLTLGTGTITVSSEHITLVLNVPTGFDLTGFANGDEVLATFTQETTGTLTLTALAQNENAQEANEDNENGDDNGNHDGGGGGGGDDGGHGGGGGGHGGGGGGGGHGHD
jgi:uncharacterized membrane protein YgcG